MEEGQLTYLDIMQEFWALLEKWLEDSSKSYSKIKKSLQQDSGELCEKCGKPMVIKWSKNGQFLACSGFPTCRNARPLDGPKPGEENEGEEAKDYGKCEKCESPLILRDGRYGKYTLWVMSILILFSSINVSPHCSNTLGLNCRYSPQKNAPHIDRR